MSLFQKSAKSFAVPPEDRQLVDVHSHILPDIDDGSKSLGASIAILNGLKSQGFTDVILTPHYVAETIYTSSRRNNLDLLDRLKQVAPEGINLYLGNELYVDRSLSSRLEQGTISSLAGSKYILVELPMSGEFEGYEDIFDELRFKGYQVILAHPERYQSTHRDFILERLYQSNVLFQCNYGSFIGQYGKNSQKVAEKLAKNKRIFALGTDIHHERDYSEIEQSLVELTKFYTLEEICELTSENPRKILENANH